MRVEVARSSPRISMGIALTLLLASLLVLANPPAANAVCGRTVPAAEALAQRRVAFVGEVQEVSDGGRLATMEVLEIWKGSDIARFVKVSGYAIGGGSDGIPDRTWEKGLTYLVIPENLLIPYVATPCSGTVRHRADGVIPEALVEAVGTAEVRYPAGSNLSDAPAEPEGAGPELYRWLLGALFLIAPLFVIRRLRPRFGEALFRRFSFEGAIGRTGQKELLRQRKGTLNVGHQRDSGRATVVDLREVPTAGSSTHEPE